MIEHSVSFADAELTHLISVTIAPNIAPTIAL
ncbi:MAG: hypothetical protein BMS9Abin05_0600 [Rhodothermia bacterium]|nr:MAG: hypothetical protein BMS9Abin05_0600 [Rhodothermia bacterium]